MPYYSYEENDIKTFQKQEYYSTEVSAWIHSTWGQSVWRAMPGNYIPSKPRDIEHLEYGQMSTRPLSNINLFKLICTIARLQWHSLPKTCYGGYNYIYIKGKAVPLQAWRGPEGSRKLRLPDFVTTAQDGGRLSALRTGHLYPQEKLQVLISVRG